MEDEGSMKVNFHTIKSKCMILLSELLIGVRARECANTPFQARKGYKSENTLD